MQSSSRFLLIASVAVPATLFAFLAWDSRRELEASTSRQVDRAASLLQDDAREVLEPHAAALRQAAADLSRRDPSALTEAAPLRELLEDLKARSGELHGLWIASADGSPVAAAGVIPDAPPPPLPERDEKAAHGGTATTRYFLSQPWTRQVDGTVEVALMLPFKAADGRAFVAGSQLDARELAQRWARHAAGRNASAALVRDDGVVLLRQPPLARGERSLSPESLAQALRNRQDTLLSIRAPAGGSERMVGIRRVGAFPIAVAYSLDRSALVADWYRQLATYGAACGFAALALIGAVTFTRRRAATPTANGVPGLGRPAAPTPGGELPRAPARLLEPPAGTTGLLETAGDAVIIMDEQQVILQLNRAAEALFIRPRDAMIGRGIRLLLVEPASDQSLKLETALRRATEAEPVLLRISGFRGDGGTFAVECSVSRWADPAGLLRYTLVVRDATERMRERQLLLQAHGEVLQVSQHMLQRVTRDFNEAVTYEVEQRQAEIARELHDSVGASLAAVALLLGGARALATAPVLPLLNKAQAQIQDTTEQVRKISRGILPTGTDPGALLAALHQFADDLCAVSEVTCTVRGRGNLREIQAATGTHIYRIVQEAATNAMRHGKATLLRITLVRAGDGYRLTVSDNGSGCDFANPALARPGVGIRSMHARARTIGGAVKIGARPGGGCRVRVTWPHARHPGPSTPPV